MPSETELDAELRRHLRRQRYDGTAHPSPERLAAYHGDELDDGGAEAVRQHLAHCPDCAALVLELAALRRGEELPGDELSEIELAAAWKRQREALEQTKSLPSAPARKGLWRQAWAVAAMLAVLSLGLSFWVLVQRQTIRQLRQPSVNPPLVNLAPVGSMRRGGGTPAEVRFPGHASRAWLILNPEVALRADSFAVSFIRLDGGERFTFGDLQPSEAGNFRIELPRSLLPAGDYEVRLSAYREGRLVPLEKYSVQINPSSEP